MDTVADGGGESEHRRYSRGAKQDRDACQHLSPPLATEAFHEQAEEHQRSKTGASSRRSVAWMTTCPPPTDDLSGMGLQPPFCPIEAAFRGEAHILQVMPWL